MINETQGKRFRDFCIMWFGQVVSVFGSGLTTFALGVWVYQKTGSATEFALIAVAGTVPAILLAPFGGVMVDRWDRRWVMAAANVGGALVSLSLVVLVLTGRLEVWNAYVIVAFGAMFNSLQIPAYMSSVTLMIPKQQFGRANGMLEFGNSLAQVLAPLSAGLLLSTIRIQGVVTIDALTFFVALITLLVIRIPRPPVSAAGRAAQGSFWGQAAYGWSYIVARPGLLGLLLFFSLVNLLLAICLVLVTPLVLSFANAAQLGVVLAMGSAGSLVGSLVMSAWGGTKQKMNAILGFAPVLGLGQVVMGLRPTVALVAAGYFLFFLVVPILNASSQAIWQTKVEPDVQGRVFAMRRLVFQTSFPLAFLAAGPLADRVFNPLLAPGGPLAGSLGRVLGVGPGRGIGLLFVVMGCLLVVAALAGSLFPRLRSLETEIPDALRESVPVGA